MGGSEGSRGYIYQAFTAVLEALTSDSWNRIYVEFPTVGDKVDIALAYDEHVLAAHQVKSSINPFEKKSVIAWINEIIQPALPIKYI